MNERKFSFPDLKSFLFIAAVTLPFALVFRFLQARTLEKAMGDFQVFCRAAWAVGSGSPLYEITDDHGWSYHYPPTLAILMRFFALAPWGTPELPWTFSYAASNTIVYILSALLFFTAVHWAATSLENTEIFNPPPAPGYWQPFWSLRTWGAGGLLIYALVTLSKGQVETLITAAAVLFLLAYQRGWRWLAGAALSFAAAIKLYPIVLIFLPAVRRDYKTLFATAAGGLFWLAALPVMACGFGATYRLYATLWQERLAGILENVPTERVAAELSFLSNDMVSISAMLGRSVYALSGGVAVMPIWATGVQYCLGALLVILLLICGHRRFWTLRGEQPAPGFSLYLGGSTLIAALPLFLPTAELQYWLLALPLFMGLIGESWRRAGRIYLPIPLLLWAVAAAAALHFSENAVWFPLQTAGPTTIVFAFLAVMGLQALGRQKAVRKGGE